LTLERNRDFLQGLETDRLLAHLPSAPPACPTSAEPLGGWEKPDVELRGHFTGHFPVGLRVDVGRAPAIPCCAAKAT
jgi:hypothetical protein